MEKLSSKQLNGWSLLLNALLMLIAVSVVIGIVNLLVTSFMVVSFAIALAS
jgi:hypothetical protein